MFDQSFPFFYKLVNKIPVPCAFYEVNWDIETRRVDETYIEDVRISTVFLCLDHNHFGNGDPILFETMIFGGKLDMSQWRYVSWDAAVRGHDAAVRKVIAAFAYGENKVTV